MTRILIPSGALGLGYDKAALQRGIEARPDLIAIDGGSTDSGPSYLGRGVSKYSRASTKTEWRDLVIAREQAGVPLVIGTAGTCGTGSTVEWLYEITCEILAEAGLSARIAVLKSDQSADVLKSDLKAGRITPLTPAPDIDEAGLESCTNIVALAGTEQITACLNTGADIIIAGRSTDTAIIAALPLEQGCHAGAAWHAAKIGECGALCASNPQSGVILLDIDDTGFTVWPLAETAMATPRSVFGHMLYENSDPFILYEPGGYLDVRDATYTQLEDGKVRVEGSSWVPSDDYTVKLEGARIAGYQTVGIALLRDVHYVENIDEWCSQILQKCCEKVSERLGIAMDSFSIELRQIGKNATLGAIETGTIIPVEVGVMGIVTAQTAALAEEIGKMLNPYLLHHPLTTTEDVPTFAFPFSPAEIQRGAVYTFCLNHIRHLSDPMSAFSLNVREVAHATA